MLDARREKDMDATTAQTKDTRAEALVASYERAGYARVQPAILQPAEPFLDLSGEDIRKRMFLTASPNGEELCLRPDLTIPVSRDYLASGTAGKPASYCYLGPVFRPPANGPPQFLPGGIASFCRAGRRAGRARRLRSKGRATARHGSFVDRRHHGRRRAFGRRDRGPLPRAIGARREHQIAPRGARAGRAFPVAN